MAQKGIIGPGGITYVDMTPEEEAQAITDALANEEARVAREAENARKQEIRAQQFVQEWEDRLRGKTAGEIVTAFNNATSAQKNELLLAMTLRWALEVK